MTFGIAIPTYFKHLDRLSSLLDSIESSTKLPDLVSISCSSQTFIDYNFDKYSFKCLINFHDEYKNPSSNRNFAASKLNTDIISFIDGDDISHPQRIQYLYDSFIQYKCDAILHDYKLSNYIDQIFLNNRYGSIDYFHNYINTAGQDNYPHIMAFPTNDRNHLPYQNAHVTVSKKIFDAYKFDTDELLKYKEDSEYNNRLVKNGITISYISNPLSLYIK